MPRLSQEKQRAVLNSLSSNRKMSLKRYCRGCQQKGDGVKDVVKKAYDFLGPIAREVGPKVLKEFIIPLLLKEAKQKYGIDPGGSGKPGGALKLAGQGKKTSPWIAHCKKVAKEQNLSYKDAMKVAKSTYRK